METKDKITILIIAVMLALAGYFLGRASSSPTIKVCPEKIQMPTVEPIDPLHMPIQTA